MNITFVSVENNISTIGFRKMAALARSLQPEAEVCYVVPVRAASLLHRLTVEPDPQDDADQIDDVASHLAKSDMVCFSSMSTHADYTKKLINAIRTKNRNSFIVWGGVHCIVDPDDAVKHADAVCIGEGQIAFTQFFQSLLEGKDYTGTKNWYFRNNGKIIKNGFMPLQSRQELETLPYPLYADREVIYKPEVGFVPMGADDYVRFEGLQYNALWSIGCPNRCVYCGNSKFLKHDKTYARLRYPSVDYLMGEIKAARSRHPHLSTVTFQDDSFMAIPRHALEEFADKWRTEVGLPFTVHGLVPRYVNPEKMKMLISSGMFRVRMGIQSGSPRTLKFYKRPDSVEAITRALGVIKDHSKYMMTPSFDFIVDNPVETGADRAATVRLLNELPRPFNLNTYPLMVIPGTELQDIAERERLDLPFINPGKMSSSLANVLIFGVALVRPPKWLLERLLKKLTDPAGTPPTYPSLFKILRFLYVTRRALLHVRFGNLSVIPNKLALLLWRTGVVSFFNKRLLKKCAAVAEVTVSPEEPVRSSVGPQEVL